MSDERRFAYQFMYLGAFAAFAIEQAEHAHTLAELTTSDEECIHVVLVMRCARVFAAGSHAAGASAAHGATVTSQLAENEETAALCPVPECEDGSIVRRTEHPDGKFSVYWVQCHLCNGLGTLPVWRANEYRASNPTKPKISGLYARKT